MSNECHHRYRYARWIIGFKRETIERIGCKNILETYARNTCIFRLTIFFSFSIYLPIWFFSSFLPLLSINNLWIRSVDESRDGETIEYCQRSDIKISVRKDKRTDVSRPERGIERAIVPRQDCKCTERISSDDRLPPITMHICRFAIFFISRTELAITSTYVDHRVSIKFVFIVNIFRHRAHRRLKILLSLRTI